MRCLSCHYSLEHLTENRCPECGRAFDPDDPATFGPQPPRALTWWQFCIWTALFWSAIIIPTYIIWNLISMRDWDATFPFAMLAIVVLTALTWTFGLVGLFVNVLCMLAARHRRTRG